MSKLKVNNIEPRADNGTLTIGSADSNTVFEGGVVIPTVHINSLTIDSGKVTVDKIDSGPNNAGYLQFDGDNRLRWSGGMVHMYKQLNMNTHTIQNVGTPEYEYDAATKGYVDAAIAALREELTN